MWCHMGNLMTPYISPKYFPQILKRDVEVMATTLLRLNPIFYLFVFFFLNIFLLLVVARTSWCDSLAFLPLSFFLLSPYIPLVQLVLLYNCFTIIAKSARAPWVCSVGTSWEGSRTSLWVCSFLGNNTHKVHVHHMKFDNSQEGFSFLPLVFVFAYLSCHHHHLHVVVGTKSKMRRLVTIKSSPSISILRP
jgi:hypothetical protein